MLLFSLFIDSGEMEKMLGRLLHCVRRTTVGSSWPVIYESDIFGRSVEAGSSRVADTRVPFISETNQQLHFYIPMGCKYLFTTVGICERGYLILRTTIVGQRS